MTRPVGVTILSVIIIVYGILRLLLALLGVAGLGLESAGVAIKYSAGTLVYATASDLVLGVLFLVSGIGALRLRGWAWTTVVLALALDVLTEIVALVIHGFGVGAVVTIVLALLALWYLLRPNVQSAFGRARQPA